MSSLLPWLLCCGHAGLLWNPQGAGGQLAVPDLCPGSSAEVFAVSQEGRSHEADPQRNQVGACQLRPVDPGGKPGSSQRLWRRSWSSWSRSGRWGEPAQAAVEMRVLHTSVPKLILSSVWGAARAWATAAGVHKSPHFSISGNPHTVDSVHRPGLAPSQLCPEGICVTVLASLCLANYMRSTQCPRSHFCESYLNSSSASTLLVSGLV